MNKITGKEESILPSTLSEIVDAQKVDLIPRKIFKCKV